MRKCKPRNMRNTRTGNIQNQVFAYFAVNVPCPSSVFGAIVSGGKACYSDTHQAVMKKKSSNWEMSPDMAFHFFLLPSLLVITLLSGSLLPLIAEFKTGNLFRIYYAALACSGVGIVLLFLARLPLYPQRRFWTIGPRELDRPHRRIYWLSYLFVFAGLGLLWMVWLRTH